MKLIKNIIAAFTAELIKQKRSRIFWITAGLFMFIPLMMSLLMYIAQHPEIGSKMGIVQAKASFFEENSWTAFFDVLNQTIATIGVIAFGFVTAWIFGREYMEQTIKDIIALPVSRSSIVIAKFAIVSLWCIILSVIMYVSGIIMGLLIHIPGWSDEILLQWTPRFFSIAFMTLVLSTVIAFIAGIGRGIIAPIGFAILFLIIAQFAALSGLGAFFPWSIPGIYSVTGSSEELHLVEASYYILAVTGIAGLFATIFWWRVADQN